MESLNTWSPPMRVILVGARRGAPKRVLEKADINRL